MENTKGKPLAFVTDGSYPNGLAAVRALHTAGFLVTVAERDGISLPETVGFWSRHCHRRFRYPDPAKDPAGTAAALAAHFREFRYDVALPVGLEMTKIFVDHRDDFAVPTLLAPTASFEIAADKRRTFEHAAAARVPIPRTVPARQWAELDPPVVFKHFAKGAVVAPSKEAAAERAALLGDRLDEYVAQEYIPGENGFGYFAFFVNGREAAYFMHERLMQIPKEGGPSVVARAVRDERLHELGRRLLESLQWNGVAMVEFKRSDRDGEYYLIEINPKLWGSLDLAIQAGCNFPVWIAQSVVNGAVPQPVNYPAGLTYQWVIPNGMKCFLRYPEFRKPFLRNLVQPRVRTDLRLSDPLPAAAALFAMASKIGAR